jgi:hypothetical protein
MSQIKIKVRPRNSIRLPGICVHCAQPAAGWMEVRKRIGRVTRLIKVPLCSRCAGELGRQSGEEERLQKIGRLVCGVLFLLALALLLLLTPDRLDFTLRLLIALSTAAGLSTVVYLWFRRARFLAARPEKKAIRNSAGIANFSWRATTFEFNNETFAKRFRDLNETLLMEV